MYQPRGFKGGQWRVHHSYQYCQFCGTYQISNAEINRFIDYIKSAKRSPGVEAIRIPGERGRGEQEKRRREGIFVEESTWDQIQEVMRKYQLPIPDPLI